VLRDRAGRVGKALVAQRLKRFEAIQSKLKRLYRLPLSQYQDIGGCRAVMEKNSSVRELVEVYRRNASRSRHVLRAEDDYITNPKTSGYRSHHLVYEYRSESPAHRVYNGTLIEIQLRSKVQHAWAAAVEAAGFITGRSIKSSEGDPRWLRYFTLASGALAHLEGAPPVPGIPGDMAALRRELRDLDRELKARSLLSLSGILVRQLNVKGADYFLLSVSTAGPEAHSVEARGFKSKDSIEANAAYTKAEREAPPGTNVVLVRASSIKGVRKSYPSFFLDTHDFIFALVEVLDGN
jgi:hypothetical protein